MGQLTNLLERGMEFKTENILSYYSYPFKVSMEGCKFQTTMFSLNTLLIDLAGYVPYVPLYWNGNGKWTWPSHRSLWLRCIIMSSASLMLFMNVQFSATIVLLTTQNGHCIYKQLKELIDMYMLANGILLDTFRRSITVFLDISFSYVQTTTTIIVLLILLIRSRVRHSSEASLTFFVFSSFIYVFKNVSHDWEWKE